MSDLVEDSSLEAQVLDACFEMAENSRVQSSRPSLMTDNHLYPQMHNQRMRTPRSGLLELSLETECRPQRIHVAEDDLKKVRDVLESLPDAEGSDNRRYDDDDDDRSWLEDLIPQLEDVHVPGPAMAPAEKTDVHSLNSQHGRVSHGAGGRSSSHVTDQTYLKSTEGIAAATSSSDIGIKIELPLLPLETNTEETQIRNTTLQREFLKRQNSRAYQIMQVYRQRLPVWNMREQILDTIARNRVVVICGDTGCGKTTQVPQLLLDNALQKSNFDIHIVCTQPRRIAAISVAERVAKERVEQLGHCVGFKMRFESAVSPYTRLLYCTTGIILRQLENDPELRQNNLTHIIIDEVHERSADSDFLLMNLRLLLQERRDLRVILMSATINAQVFSEFFGGCPILQIPGRTYEVKQYYLEDALAITDFQLSRQVHAKTRNTRGSRTFTDKTEDWELTEPELQLRYPNCSRDVIRALSHLNPTNINYELIVMLVIWIAKSQQKESQKGAILIFMPGLAEIEHLHEKLDKNTELQMLTELKLVPVHSSLSTEEQNEAFLTPDEGVTKIVIATNIAETSITINDIVYVIDPGLMKEMRYDHKTHMNILDTVLVSRANAIQRRGRAGRVQNGVCFHLFTSHHYKHRLQDQPMPEIQRISLNQVVLQVKMMSTFKNKSVEEVLGRLMEPPSQKAIDVAIRQLCDLGALDENEELTALGYYVAQLPVDVRIGKLILFGAIFRCLDPALTVAAVFSYKTPFITPFDQIKRVQARERKMDFADGNSDFLTLLNAYKGWYEAKREGFEDARRFCFENFLNMKILQMLARHKQQFVELLSEIGFIQTGIRVRDVMRTADMGSDGVAQVTGVEANENSNNWDLISAIIVAALYPNIGQVPTDAAGIFSDLFMAAFGSNGATCVTKDGRAKVHPSSVNFSVLTFSKPFLVYHEKVKTKHVYIRDCSEVSALALFLFGGGRVIVETSGSQTALQMDHGWIKLKASTVTAKVLLALRKELNQLLSIKMASPETDLVCSPRGSRVIRCIVDLISAQQ